MTSTLSDFDFNSLQDPIELYKALWLEGRLCDFQKDIIRSVWRDDETYVVAGNMLGKDYVAGRIVVMFFLTRHPCRIFTTSVADDHLDVLWGEINSAIQESVLPLDSTKGGNLIINHHHIRKLVNGDMCPLSYIKGGTSPTNKGEKIQGHHIAQWGDGIPRTLFMADEASGLLKQYYEMATTWANCMLIFGNAWPCENFFKQAFKGRTGTKDHGGDIPRKSGRGFHRWTTRIQAVDSPNVRLAILQEKRGLKPTNEIIVPGVKPWSEYQKNLAMWPEDQQTVSLSADWYEGAEQKLFPAAWLEFAEKRAEELRGFKRVAKAVGIDTGEGSANTSLCAVDERGIIGMESCKTPKPKEVVKMVIAFAKRHKVPWDHVFFDLGGGGHWVAGFMREMSYQVRTVAFGGAATKGREPGVKVYDEKLEEDELKMEYFNKRTEMYGKFSVLIDPSRGEGFGIPSDAPVFAELRRQMLPIPRLYDSKGRLWLPPKHKKDKDSTVKTIVDLIGCSPDELDSAVLAVHGMTVGSQWATAGVG